MITFFIFFAILFVLILSHECGHFFSARFFGIRVDEFGFGLPPRIGGIQRGTTLYSLNWLPFGGFVRIHGEEGESEDSDSFGRKSALVRSMVLISGVAANIIVAYILISILAFQGVTEPLTEEMALQTPNANIMILESAANSPATSAGILVGDIVLKIGESQTTLFVPKTIGEFQAYVKERAGNNLWLLIQRNKTEMIVGAIPRVNPPEGEGALGIALFWTHQKRAVWYQAPIEGARLTYELTKNTLQGLWSVVRDAVRGDGENIPIAGPVGIYNIVGDARSSGIETVLFLTATLSINLALINILPIPGLDGGRFAFVIAESITGRRISSRISSVVHGAGLALLLFFMVFVTYIDISRIW